MKFEKRRTPIMKKMLALAVVILMVFVTIPALAQTIEVAQGPGGKEVSPPMVPIPAALNLVGKWISSQFSLPGYPNTKLKLVVEKVTPTEKSDVFVISGICMDLSFTSSGEIKEGKLSFTCSCRSGNTFVLSFSLDGTDSMSGYAVSFHTGVKKFTIQRQ
jgi:hypothetical protein